jgi:hypothetical protein
MSWLRKKKDNWFAVSAFACVYLRASAGICGRGIAARGIQATKSPAREARRFLVAALDDYSVSSTS